MNGVEATEELFVAFCPKVKLAFEFDAVAAAG